MTIYHIYPFKQTKTVSNPSIGWFQLIGSSLSIPKNEKLQLPQRASQMHSACVSDHATAAAVQDPVENTLSAPDTWKSHDAKKKKGWNDPHMVKSLEINSWSPQLRFFHPQTFQMSKISTNSLGTSYTISCKDFIKVDVNISLPCRKTTRVMKIAYYPPNPAPSDIDEPLWLIFFKLPIIKWFIPGVYLSPVWMTPEFGTLTSRRHGTNSQQIFGGRTTRNHKSAPSASVDCSYHWSRLSKRCERQSLKCNFENGARWSSNKYTYAMAMYYRLKIID